MVRKLFLTHFVLFVHTSIIVLFVPVCDVLPEDREDVNTPPPRKPITLC